MLICSFSKSKIGGSVPTGVMWVILFPRVLSQRCWRLVIKNCSFTAVYDATGSQGEMRNVGTDDRIRNIGARWGSRIALLPI